MPLHPGCWLIFLLQPPRPDPTSSTSRTQTFVGLISSAGALSYFVSEAAGDVRRWKCRVAFYPSLSQFLLEPTLHLDSVLSYDGLLRSL